MVHCALILAVATGQLFHSLRSVADNGAGADTAGASAAAAAAVPARGASGPDRRGVGSGSTPLHTLEARGSERVNVKDFGAVGDGVTDDFAAIMAAINSATYTAQPQFPSGPAVYFPPGKYYVSRTIELRKAVRLYGDDSGLPYSSGARLSWPPGVNGIVVHRGDTSGLGTAAFTTGADSTIIEGLQLWSTRTTPKWRKTAKGGETSLSGLDDSGAALTYTPVFESVFVNSTLRERNNEYAARDGTSITGLAPLHAGDVVEVVPFGGSAIWLRARALIRNVYIREWLGSGIAVIANATMSGTARGNANNFRIEGGRVELCDRHGLHVTGADANAGYVLGLDVSSNKGWGIFDASFLGNTYIAAHSAANGLGAYKTENANARNVLLGCYSESGQPGSSIAGPALVIGGIHAAGFVAGGQVAGSAGGRLVATTVGARDNTATATLGGGLLGLGDATQLMMFELRGDSVPFRGRFYEGDFQLLRGNGDTAQIEITGTNTTSTFGRSVAQPGKLQFPAGYFLGASGSGRYIGLGAAAPTSGEYARGDVIWNSAPSPGGKVGWICTTGGTAGVNAVFKPFGAIDP